MPIMEDAELSTQQLTSKDMPYVMFETREIEDMKRTKADGIMRFKDQDYAITTHPGGKGNTIYKIETFFEQMEADRKIGRIHPNWLTKWRDDYKLFKAGQEIPVEGTPIKGWKLLTGAQQKELLHLNIVTVEQLANLTDDAMRNVGMGAVTLKQRAQAWLAQNEGKEAGAVKLAQALTENKILQDTIANLTEKVEALAKQVEAKKK